MWSLNCVLWRHHGSQVRRTTIVDSFSCIQFLRQLHLSLNTRHFINLTLPFEAKGCSVRLLSAVLTAKRLAENDAQTDVKPSQRRPDVIHEILYTPPCKTNLPCSVIDADISVGYARKAFLFQRDEIYLIYIANISWSPRMGRSTCRLTVCTGFYISHFSTHSLCVGGGVRIPRWTNKHIVICFQYDWNLHFCGNQNYS